MRRSRSGKLLLCVAGVVLWNAASADQSSEVEAKVAALLARMERVAEKTGFSSAHQLRRVWRRWETASPTQHRPR